ncbi:MAG: hypothetical protein LBU99_01760 [Spirochaetaceae bacterium]|jgi:hypothetical protein|nr:hypothetical protein [Spirochaetaceae bacterium]
MIGEIDKDFYCSANNVNAHGECRESNVNCIASFEYCNGCASFHLKHPTPKQFKEEYDREWDGAMYGVFDDVGVIDLEFCHIYAMSGVWFAASSAQISAAKNDGINFTVVCACTPWGKPPADWRPE